MAGLKPAHPARIDDRAHFFTLTFVHIADSLARA